MPARGSKKKKTQTSRRTSSGAHKKSSGKSSSGAGRSSRRAKTSSSPSTSLAAAIRDKTLVVIVERLQGDAAGATARTSNVSDGAESGVAGRIGALVDTKGNRVQVEAPLPIVHGLLKMLRLLPDSVRNRTMDFLAGRGIALESGDSPEADERLIRQISRLNVAVQTETLRVHVFTR